MLYTIGIDEVGRGPLAGPVVVAAVCIQGAFRLPYQKFGPLRDSKQLTAAARERWFAYLTAHPQICFAVAKVGPARIDRWNISRAANRDAARAFGRLREETKLTKTNCNVFLDGGLYINNKKQSLAQGARTIVKGDETIRAVALASIIAKVTRDRLMVRLAKRYPEYGFERHKGYGTKLHKEKIKRHGPSPVHRLTFLS